MSRKHRIWYPGAMYHITARGNRKNSVFYDPDDYRRYLSMLDDTRSRYPFVLHSYCLMPNHIHLQIETISSHIQLIMKELHGSYARTFNRKYDYIGHLFQGRYHSKLIESDDYFLEVSRYIHLNPVDAGVVKQPEDYLWSSYKSYISDSIDLFVDQQKLLGYFPEPVKENYREFVGRKMEEKEDDKAGVK